MVIIMDINDMIERVRQFHEKHDFANNNGSDMKFRMCLMMEEVGELASALRGDDRENLAEEFADVIAWLTTIANVAGVDLNAALVNKYGRGCPGCGRLVCGCSNSEKP